MHNRILIPEKKRDAKETSNDTAVGHYVPDKILSNADLEKMIDTNDEWIRTRTGIRERRILTEGATSDMVSAPQKRIEEPRHQRRRNRSYRRPTIRRTCSSLLPRASFKTNSAQPTRGDLMFRLRVQAFL